jgi:hypothetical protein
MYRGKELVWRMKQGIGVFFVILVISFLTCNAFADLSTVPAGAAPVYRFNNTIVGNGDHFYTIDPNEANYIIAHYPWLVYEGIAYYAYQAGTTINGTYTMTFDWGCDGSATGTTSWTINSNGTWTVNGVNNGTWRLLGNHFQLTYAGISTIYQGTAIGNHIEGTMTSGASTGCFKADK